MSRRSVGAGIVGLAGVAAVFMAVPRSAPDRGAPAVVMHQVARPPPTTQVLFQQAEEKGKAGRRQWMADLHRAPPDVDWQQVEAENGQHQIDKRNAIDPLARAALPGRWVERGSDNQAGSMFAMRQSTDGAAWVAGSDLGGLWRGSLQGDDWTPLGDNLYGGVHHLWVIDPDTPGGPDVLLASPTWGTVHRSADDGQTWEVPTGLASLIGTRALVGSTDGSGALWIAGVTQSWGLSVLRSMDGGRSFQQMLSSPSVFGDLWVPRNGGAGVWAVGGDTLYMSMDLGETWVEAALPVSASQGRLTGSEATVPPRIWFESKEWYGPADLYRTDDLGASWVDLGRLDDAWEVLTASTVDPNLVAYGGVELHYSTDGGNAFQVVNTWDVYYDDPETLLHADLMAVTVTPDGAGGEIWGIGCHGGVYTSDDGLQTVQNLSLSGLRVSQYYNSLTHRMERERVLVGSQDQGLQWTTNAPDNNARLNLDQHLSGDFGHLISSDGEHEWVYSVYPGFVLTFRDEDAGQLGFLEYPPDDAHAPWLPTLVPHPDKKRQFFFLGAHLWKFQFADDAWEVEQWSTRNFGEGTGEYASAMVFDPFDPDRAWAATSLGRVFRSTDGGEKWRILDVTGPEPNYLYGSALVASGVTPGVVVLGGSGYEGTPVYRSLDGGDTWEDWSQGLPATLVYTLVEARDGSGRMFAGSETSAWMRAPDAAAWVDITGADAPVTVYSAAEVLGMENTIRFSTFGRGLWDFQLDPPGEGCWQTRDDDLDGAPCELDCNDADAAIHPGAEDTCDGIDSDCDGTVEEDADGDGFLSCLDCDDTNAGASPATLEILCDGIDNDCDGHERCPEISGAACGCNGAPGGLGFALWLALFATRRGRGARG